MLYIKTEDEYYYTSEGKQEVLERYKAIGIQNLIVFPKEKDIINISEEKIKNSAFLAPYGPERISPLFFKNLFFETIVLPNRYGVLTTGQKRAGFTEAEVLAKQLGVDFIVSNLTMKDYGGASVLHDLVELVKQKIKYREATKGFLLTGLPGTGKSFFAKCFAGEINATLVSFDLSVFMEREDTVSAINNFFKFFETTPGSYVVWIDEIEKMFTTSKAQEVMGALLTNINESNNSSDDTYFFIIATANNVSTISEKNPELFRSGRFDEIIFLLSPKFDDVPNLFKIHQKKMIGNLKNNIFPSAIYEEAKTLIKIGVDEYKRIRNMRKEIAPKVELIGGEIVLSLEEEGKGSLIKEISELGFRDAKQKMTNMDDVVEKINNKTREDLPEIDPDKMINAAMAKYRESNSSMDRFIYTPGEIEKIVKLCFEFHYFFNHKEINPMDVVNEVKPIQTLSKDGTRDIIAKAANFIEV